MALLCKEVKDPAVLALAEGCTALAHLANDEPWRVHILEFFKQIMVDFHFFHLYNDTWKNCMYTHIYCIWKNYGQIEEKLISMSV